MEHRVRRVHLGRKQREGKRPGIGAEAEGDLPGWEIQLEEEGEPGEIGDTPLPLAPERRLPEKIRQMLRLYEYGTETRERRILNFCRQARFMEDFEAEEAVPFPGEVEVKQVSYQNLTARQLHSYFSWRTRIRQGEFPPAPVTCATLYIFELLNGFGVSSPSESFEKLVAFREGFLEAQGSEPEWRRLKADLDQWLLDLAILERMPLSTVRELIGPEKISKEEAVALLMEPDDHTDEEILEALGSLLGKERSRRLLEDSPLIDSDPERVRHLFAQIWRVGVRDAPWESPMNALFQATVEKDWEPMKGALYEKEIPEDFCCLVNLCHVYLWAEGKGRVRHPAYQGLGTALYPIVRDIDGLLRRSLMVDSFRALSKEAEEIRPYVERALLEERKARIQIDFGQLDAIREEALATQESLLVEEDEEEPWEEREEVPVQEEPVQEDPSCGLPLDEVETRVLRLLARGEPCEELLRKEHRLPQVVADAINESLWEEFEDTVVSCEEERLSLVEDYIEEIRKRLGL